MLEQLKEIFTTSGIKPDFIIVGAQKAGTTALFRILNEHSKIKGAGGKELHFFDRDPLIIKGKYSNYHNYFKGLKEGCIYFEATPSYLYHPEAAQRIFKYNPDIKIIISLRNPADRALSAWTMYHHHFKTDEENFQYYDERSFEQAIEEELKTYKSDTWANNKRSYINRGIYYTQIKKYLDTFPKENILIIESKELSKNHSATVKNICDFLGQPYEDLKQVRGNESVVDNKNNYNDTLEKLKEFYKPFNEKLFELINKKYDW
jgi:hypothetical protein